MLPNPPSKAHGFAMQIFKSGKKFLGPPLPNPGDALLPLSMIETIIVPIVNSRLNWLTCCKRQKKCSNFAVADKHDAVLEVIDGQAIL